MRHGGQHDHGPGGDSCRASNYAKEQCLLPWNAVTACAAVVPSAWFQQGLQWPGHLGPLGWWWSLVAAGARVLAGCAVVAWAYALGASTAVPAPQAIISGAAAFGLSRLLSRSLSVMAELPSFHRPPLQAYETMDISYISFIFRRREDHRPAWMVLAWQSGPARIRGCADSAVRGGRGPVRLGAGPR
jgi:hypothetical protein